MMPVPFKRCGCRDQITGKKFGRKCPRLKGKDHGSWWYRFDAPSGSAGKRRQAWIGPFPTKKATEESIAEELARLGRDQHVADRALTFGRYLDDWLAGKASLKATTRAAASEHIELYFRAGLGHIRMVDLRDYHFEELYAAMRALGHVKPGSPAADSELVRRLLAARTNPPRPMGPARIRRVHATAMSALNTAVKRRKITANPAAHVELEAGRKPKALVWTPGRVEYWRRTGRRPSPVMVWTPEQAGAFLDLVADDELYAMWHLLTYRGLRRGEAIGLPDYDVDLDDATVHIRETLVRAAEAIDGPDDLDDPKSEAGARTLALDPCTGEVLADYRKRRDERRRALGKAWVESGRFFTKLNGEPPDPAWVTQRFGYLVARAARVRKRCSGTTARGRPCRRSALDGEACHQHGGRNEGELQRDGLPPVRLHDLRHGSATYALAAGIPIKVVSEDLGHSTTKITEDLYTSVLPELKQSAAEAVAATIPRSKKR